MPDIAILFTPAAKSAFRQFDRGAAENVSRVETSAGAASFGTDTATFSSTRLQPRAGQLADAGVFSHVLQAIDQASGDALNRFTIDWNGYHAVDAALDQTKMLTVGAKDTNSLARQLSDVATLGQADKSENLDDWGHQLAARRSAVKAVRALIGGSSLDEVGRTRQAIQSLAQDSLDHPISAPWNTSMMEYTLVQIRALAKSMTASDPMANSVRDAANAALEGGDSYGARVANYTTGLRTVNALLQ